MIGSPIISKRTVVSIILSMLIYMIMLGSCNPSSNINNQLNTVVTQTHSKLTETTIRTPTPTRIPLENTGSPYPNLLTPTFVDIPSCAFILRSGKTLVCEGGLTPSGSDILLKQNVGYFYLTFTIIPDDIFFSSLDEHRIEIVRHLIDKNGNYAYSAVVNPTGLSYLEKLTQDGLLAWGGPIPPYLKTTDVLDKNMYLAPRKTSDVNVVLLTNVSA